MANSGYGSITMTVAGNTQTSAPSVDTEHTIALTGRYGETTSHMWQYDKGQILKFSKNIANGSEVQFDNGIVKQVENGSCKVPDSLLEIPGEHRAWLQKIGEDHETTWYKICFTVKERDEKDDYISPDDEQTFREWIVDILEEAKETAEDAKEAAETITEYVEQAEESAEAAETAAQTAGNAAAGAAAAQTLTQEYKTAAETAKAGAESAKTAAETAKTDAETAARQAEEAAAGISAQIPTKTSQLQNDSGFLTEHQDLSGIKDTVRGIMNNGSEFGNNPVNTDATHLMIYSKVSADNPILISFSSPRTVRAHKYSRVNGEYVFAESGAWHTASFKIEPDEFYYDFEVAFTSGLDIRPAQAHVSVTKNSIGELYNVVPGVTTCDEMRNAILAGKILFIRESGSGTTSTFYCTTGDEEANGSYYFYNLDGPSIRIKAYLNGNWNDYSEDRVTQNDFSAALGSKQAKLTAGDNINIKNNVISAVIPNKVSSFENDSGYLTAHQDISGLVEKVEGKGLSSNDFSDAEKAKLDGMPAAESIADKQDLANYLAKPSSPVVGQYLKISSINSDGSVVLENVDLPIATVGGEHGLVKIYGSDYFGITKSEGCIAIKGATESEIKARTVNSKPITPSRIVTAVDSVLCSTAESEKLDADKQLAARQRIGAEYAGEWECANTGNQSFNGTAGYSLTFSNRYTRLLIDIVTNGTASNYVYTSVYAVDDTNTQKVVRLYPNIYKNGVSKCRIEMEIVCGRVLSTYSHGGNDEWGSSTIVSSKSTSLCEAAFLDNIIGFVGFYLPAHANGGESTIKIYGKK